MCYKCSDEVIYFTKASQNICNAFTCLHHPEEETVNTHALTVHILGD